MRHIRPFFAALFIAALAVGCASTNATMLGTAPDDLEPLSVEEVTAYSDTSSVQCDYDRVAALQTSGSVEGMDEKMIKSAKEKAAEIGANAIILKRLSSDSGTGINYDYGSTEGRYLAIYERRPCE